MRTTTVKLAAVVAALLFGGTVMAQAPGAPTDLKKLPPEKKPSQLEELIAQALRDNPDVRVAEAKMREAEAELNRARLQAIQKVVAHQHTTETLANGVKTAEANYVAAEANLRLAEAQNKRADELAKKGVLAQEDLDTARAKLEQSRATLEIGKATLQAAKADLAKAQADLPYLLGKGTKDGDQERIRTQLNRLIEAQVAQDRVLYVSSINAAYAAIVRGQQPQGTVADKLRKALGTSFNLKLQDQPLGDVLEFLQRSAGVPIVDTLPREFKGKKLTLNVQDVSLGAAFQLLEDAAGVRFAVRDYGILVTDKLPSGVLPLHDFWKGGDKPKGGDEKPKSSGRNPPENVEGEVTAVQADGGLAEISVAKDASLAKGQMLEVYRHAGDKAYQYLGTLRVEAVKDRKAVGKFIGNRNTPVKVGDRVSSQFVVD